MQESFKVLTVDNAFSKWFVEGKGKNKIPPQFSSYLRNARINNGATTQRLWHSSVVTSNIWTYVKWLAKNTNFWIETIFACVNNEFRPIDLTTNNYLTSVWTLNGDTDCNVIQYGKYSIILTWTSLPYVRDWSSFFQVLAANMPNTNTPAVNPIIWETFSNYTFIAWNTPQTENILYVCVPPTLTTQQNCYDWAWTWSDSLVFSSKILWLRSTIDRLFVFTERTIEIITTQSIQSWNTISSPVAQWEFLASYGSVIAAGKMVLFLTKSKKIKTLDYTPGITQPLVGELSDRPITWIDLFMQWLSDDQSQSYGYYNKNQNIVKWFLRSKNSVINDVSLVYDFVNDSWFVDNNKYFNKFIEFSWSFYCWSMLSANIIKDETWYDDDGEWIAYEYQTPEIDFWNSTSRKQFREMSIAWQINIFSKIWVEILVDWQTVFKWVVDWSVFLSNATALLDGIGSQPIGWEPIWWQLFWINNISTLYWFESVVTKWNLRSKGKRIKAIFTWSEVGQNFSIDTLSFTVAPIWDYDRKDQF